ncbi:MAG: universal stress protein [Pseudomonadota bacterium]
MTRSLRNRLLVAVDGTEQALAMVRYVGRVFPPEGAEIVLFNVFNRIPDAFWDIEKDMKTSPAFRSAAAWESMQQNAMTGFMDQAKRALLNSGFPAEAVQVRVQPMDKGVARDIVAEAALGYDAVVLGRKGYSRLMDLIMGSVANKLVNKLKDVSVLMVGGEPANNRFLVAVDGSKGSERAVKAVTSVLHGKNVEVKLFHAVRTLDPSGRAGAARELREDKDSWLEDHLRSIRPMMEAHHDALVGHGLDPKSASIRLVTDAASRAGAIIEEARGAGFGTIVIGRRGFSEVQEHPMGRVTNKVLQLARDLAVWVVA